MSSGPFKSSKYENLAGNVVYPCRVQPETEEFEIDSVANDPPAAAATTGVARIALRRGKRAFGPTIRTVTIEMTADGTGAVDYLKTGATYTLPTLTNTFHDGLVAEAVGTYQGVACKVVSKFPE